MRINALIVHAHPERTSFTSALKDRAVAVLVEKGCRVEVSDLYGLGFDPVAGRKDFTTIFNAERFHYQSEQRHASENEGFAADLVEQQRRLLECDLLILTFPLWHFGVPAILKGWFERVMAMGVAAFDRRRFDDGIFVGRRAILCTSTGGTKDRFTERGGFGDMNTILHPTQNGVLRFLGFDPLEPFVAYAAPRVSEIERMQYLVRWEKRLLDAIQDESWKDSLSSAHALTQERSRFIEEDPWSKPG